MQKYDPYRGVKLSTYAAWWIRAYILKFILDNWRMVKIGTTQAQRQLFFNLRKEREQLERMGVGDRQPALAAALDVSERDVIEMERRLAAPETSLDAPPLGAVGRGDGAHPGRHGAGRGEHAARSCRSRRVSSRSCCASSWRCSPPSSAIAIATSSTERLLADKPMTLEQLGAEHGISRERARQLEDRLKKQLRVFLEAELGDSVTETTGHAADADADRAPAVETRPRAVDVVATPIGNEGDLSPRAVARAARRGRGRRRGHAQRAPAADRDRRGGEQAACCRASTRTRRARAEDVVARWPPAPRWR